VVDVDGAGYLDAEAVASDAGADPAEADPMVSLMRHLDPMC
jgi:hypothetical protein